MRPAESLVSADQRLISARYLTLMKNSLLESRKAGNGVGTASRRMSERAHEHPATERSHLARANEPSGFWVRVPEVDLTLFFQG